MAARPDNGNSPPWTKRARVYAIAQLMASGEWGDGTDHTKRLAEEWGLAIPSVQHMAAEASRLLEFTTTDRDHLVRLTRLRLREVGEENGRDRVFALRTILEHLGELRKRVEVSGPGGVPVTITAGVTATIKAEPMEHLRALLRDPPLELEAVLTEEWGPRTVFR